MPLKTDPRAMFGLRVEDAFRDALASDLAAHEQRRASFLDWAMRVPESKGPLNFARWPFQRELYEEGFDDKEVVVMKATQLGISAWLVRWALCWADMHAARVLYIFPRERQLLDFCVAEGERVLMADGSLRAIESVREGDRVWSSDGLAVRADTVERTWVRGAQPVYRARMRGGRELRATAQHRVYTNEGWKRIGELRTGDLVCVPAQLPAPERSVVVSRDDAFLLALWLAEGSKGAPGYAVCCSNRAVRLRLAEIAPTRGWVLKEDVRHAMRLTRTKHDETTPGKLLERYGVRGMRTETVSVPDAIMCADDAAANEFLQTYFACDGYVGDREATIASASERMVRDLQALAARLGLAATVRSQQPTYPGARLCWVLAISGAAARQWLNVPGKPQRGPERDARRGKHAAFANDQEIALRELRATGMRHRDIAEALGISQGTVSRRLRRREWCVPASTDLRWSEVLSVEPDGVAQTYDLTTREHHAFFTEGALTHNSDGRIKPLILGEYLRTRVPPASVMNKTLKSVGLGIVYFRGSEAEAGLESIDADALCLDEHDLLVQSHIPIAERRVGGQDSMGMIRRIGFPTISDHGIHKEYKRSDQREWTVRCERCGEWQALTWADNVDLTRGIRVCRACRQGPLDVAQGEWVAGHPGRTTRGYHVTKLILPDDAIVPTLIKASEEQVAYRRQVFFNRDLGEPWEAEGARLTAAMIAAAQRGFTQASGYDGTRPVMMGVDVASVRALNVWITEQTSETQGRVLYLGLVDSFDELAKLMDRFRVVMAGIDHLPENRLAQAFANKFAGRVYIINYAGDQQRDILSVDDQQRRASSAGPRRSTPRRSASARNASTCPRTSRPTSWRRCAPTSAASSRTTSAASRCCTAPTDPTTGCRASSTRWWRTSAGGSASRSTTRRSSRWTR